VRFRLKETYELNHLLLKCITLNFMISFIMSVTCRDIYNMHGCGKKKHSDTVMLETKNRIK